VASGPVSAAGGLFVAVCGGVACFCGSVPGLCGGVGCLGLREHRRYVEVAFVCGGVAAVGDHVPLVGEPVPAVRDGVAVGCLLVAEVGCSVAFVWGGLTVLRAALRSVTARSLSCDAREPAATEVGADIPVQS